MKKSKSAKSKSSKSKSSKSISKVSKSVAKVFCEECGVKIPSERIAALPDTKYCVKCSAVIPQDVIPCDPDCCDTTDLIDSSDF